MKKELIISMLTRDNIAPIGIEPYNNDGMLENVIPVDDIDVRKVPNINKLLTGCRIYSEPDRLFRTIGDVQEKDRYWVGKRTHDFFLDTFVNTIFIEDNNSKNLALVFSTRGDAENYYKSIKTLK